MSTADSLQITIQPSGHQYAVPPGDTVLKAALAAGFNLPYGCRNGACGSCKGKILDGRVDYGHYTQAVLAEIEKNAGYALFCCAKPLTDLVIEVKEIGANKDIVVKKLPCRVAKVEKVTEDVAILYLKLPANERMQFLAGQYIDFILKDGDRRSFSMANAPHDDELVQLHVRHVSGGKFTVTFDGKKVIGASDDSFADAGKVGLWTKADSVTLFDDFTFGSK